MSTWPEAKLIEKPCKVCGDPMYCTPSREICHKCRKQIEKDKKRYVKKRDR